MSRKGRPFQSRLLSAFWNLGSRFIPSVLDSVLAPHPRWIQVTAPEVPVAGLPAAWAGARVAILTDLHIGRFIRADYVRQVVRRTNALAPDLVALLGDYLIVDGALSGSVLDCFGDLRGPLGKFAVLGNHDFWHEPEEVGAALQRAGITVLRNSRRLVARGGAELCLAGVDDPWESEADLAGALAGVSPETARVLLCHNPDFAEQMPASPRVDLMLCGHTHGGQVRLPFLTHLLSPVRHKKYLQGLVRGPRCPVYICRGAGVVGPPLRFRCPPEIACLTLQPARENGCP